MSRSQKSFFGSKKSNTLYCFSPPVMLATVIVESSLLAYTYWRYKISPITRVVMLILFFLAVFQLSEYNVCGRFNLDASTWSRIGYVAITLLPPLGVHLIQLISGRGWREVKWVAYGSGLAWAIIFGATSKAFTGQVCAGNYVIFKLTDFASTAYYAYYYFWLFISMVMAVYWAWSATRAVREALLLYVFGYLIFLVPTTIINSIYPSTRMGIPSIMCGFAVMYAFILVVGILPVKLDKHKA